MKPDKRRKQKIELNGSYTGALGLHPETNTTPTNKIDWPLRCLARLFRV